MYPTTSSNLIPAEGLRLTLPTHSTSSITHTRALAPRSQRKAEGAIAIFYSNNDVSKCPILFHYMYMDLIHF
jgi:hypothetical protein